ncbi:uncharacterized protein LOC124887866 [Capsicum annuum]|uniref:uncharacterized protein LOC124887866 n=1 Tax=Capsicum annuum TaxID=4072 RepID=UPI001FB167B8|nr:uncharacterized protein LOC124887866 [Capsicum annuum]
MRHRGFIALASASSGMAASLLPGGRTAHSRFKLPINIDENFSCNISKQSSMASLIRDAKLILWDEISMAKKEIVEVLDLLLKDLMERKIFFGGKVVVFSGDFRQTLAVVRNGKREDFIQFEATVIENSGSATALIADEPAESMLQLSSEEIYEIHCVKENTLNIAPPNIAMDTAESNKAKIHNTDTTTTGNQCTTTQATTSHVRHASKLKTLPMKKCHKLVPAN